MMKGRMMLNQGQKEALEKWQAENPDEKANFAIFRVIDNEYYRGTFGTEFFEHFSQCVHCIREYRAYYAHSHWEDVPIPTLEITDYGAMERITDNDYWRIERLNNA